MQIVALSGSSRTQSFNTALLRAAASLAAAPARIEVRTIAGIPLYDGDVEQAQGLPEAVVALKDEIAASAGLVIATPEYNNSLPGPLKNAIDWCSRPMSDQARVFGGKPVALCGAAPGRGATALAHVAWLPVFRVLGLRYWPHGQLMVPAAHEAFGDDGGLRDEKLRERVRAFADGFAAFCAESAAVPSADR